MLHAEAAARRPDRRRAARRHDPGDDGGADGGRARDAGGGGQRTTGAEALEDARATLQTAVERARRLTFELRPPLLDAQGIAAALRDLAAEVGTEGGFAVDARARGPVLATRPRISPSARSRKR